MYCDRSRGRLGLIPLAGLLAWMGCGEAALAEGASRDLSGYGGPNVTFTVSITLDPPPGTGIVVVEDAPPAGWVVSNISSAGGWDAGQEKVKWGPFFDPAIPTLLTYEVTPPADATGKECFTGAASFDSPGEPITGDTCVGGTPPVVPPELPASERHQARKNRYVTIDSSTNAAESIALKVTLLSMRRCSGDLARACTVDEDCEAAAPGSGTCIQHPDVSAAGPWWVQAPQQEPLGCIPGPCGDEDWFARVDGTVHFDVWTLATLHVGDCEMVPVATYAITACLPPDGSVCSDPLTIGTIEQPFVAPGFRGGYGDVAGAVDPVTESFAPPDGITNVIDVSTYVLTTQNYGTATLPQTHPTWVDLHGLGDGQPPQYILNVSDLGQILKAVAGDAWTDDPGNMTPSQCP